jgi:acetylornithine deacetylase/succinyl-diaminopimelate desuccinylase-like protein
MAMGRVLNGMATELPPRFATRTHPLVPSPTLNVGLIEGGVKPNVIAEHCRVVLDRRMLPGEQADAVLQELRDVAERAVHGSGAAVEVRAAMVKPGSEVAADAEIVAECQRAFQAVTGRTAEIRGSAGYTDAHWFNLDVKIPAVAFGPWYLHRPTGSVSDIPDEFNYVEDVLTGTRVYAQLIANVIG